MRSRSEPRRRTGCSRPSSRVSRTCRTLRSRAGATRRPTASSGRGATPRAFDFPPQAHWDLGPALGILDFERAAKVAGARFTVLSGAAARLSRALIQLFLDVHVDEQGYREVLPPFLANADSLFGTGQLPKFAADLFRTTDGYYLIPTAEVPVTNLHRDEMLAAADLPIAVHRVHALLPFGGGSGGARHARHDPPAPVRQGRGRDAGSARGFAGGARDADGAQRGAPAPARAPLPRRLALHGRSRIRLRQDLRPRGVAAGPERLQGDLLLLELRGVSRRAAPRSVSAGPRARSRSSSTRSNGSGLPIGRTIVAILENYQRADGSVEIPEVASAVHARLDRDPAGLTRNELP